MNQYKSWTPAEVALLCAHYTSATHDALLAMLPGRTWTAIRRAASCHKVQREDWGRRHLKWTPAEIATLRRIYPTKGGVATIAAMPRFTAQAVRQQAHHLGLKAPKQEPKEDNPLARERRWKKNLADKKRRAAKSAAKAKPPKPPKPVKVAKHVVVKPTPKPAAPTPLANNQRMVRLAREEEKKQKPAVTAEMVRKLPAAHPARLAWTRAAYHGPEAAAAAYYSAMQQAA